MNDISPLNKNEPIFDVAQLAHVELLTPDLEGTLHFFKDLLGMQETERRAQSVYLRGYEEQYHHSLKVTAAPRAGLGHVAWRARSPQALERRVVAIEATDSGGTGSTATSGMAAPTGLTYRRATVWNYSGTSTTSLRRLGRKRLCTIVRRSARLPECPFAALTTSTCWSRTPAQFAIYGTPPASCRVSYQHRCFSRWPRKRHGWSTSARANRSVKR